MNCEAAQAELKAYQDGELDRLGAWRVRRHVRRCASCAEELTMLQKLHAFLLSADLVEAGTISGKMLKDLYDLAFERNQDFPAIYEKEKPQQITDMAAIEKFCDEVITANPKQVEQYRGGKAGVLGFLVGQVMKLSKGQANPATVNEVLKKKLG